MREYFEDVIIKFNSVDKTENCLKCKHPIYFINATVITAKILKLNCS